MKIMRHREVKRLIQSHTTSRYLDADKQALGHIRLSMNLQAKGSYGRTMIGTRKVHSDKYVKWGRGDGGKMKKDRCDSDQHSTWHTQLVITDIYVTHTRG